MYTDFVFPENNEKEFIQMAEKLGWKSLVFCYDSEGKAPEAFPESGIKCFSSIVASKPSSGKMKNTNSIVIAKSTGDDRWAFEKSPVKIVFGLEESQKRDFMHHRASGLNQVLCRLAKKNDVSIGFSFSSLISSKAMLRSQIMGRMMQNAKFCRKYRIRTIIASFARNPWHMRSPEDFAAFGECIGMHPKEAKDSVSWER